MGLSNYIYFEINGQRVDLDPDAQVPLIDYALEDEDNFEQKKSAEVFGIELPPTLLNQALSNTLQNPSVLDTTPDAIYEKPMPARYIANGEEILSGKFFIQGVKERNGVVQGYRGKMYGLNGDWVIDLKEKTLYDFIQPRTHAFDMQSVAASWNYDGRSEAQDFVYAPVRYRKPFGAYPANSADPDVPTQPADDNVLINDLKPSFSIYWLLYRGFKSVGYRLKSTFFDTDYYRRSVMPWTWGGFDYLDDSRWEPLKFLAKQETRMRFSGDYDQFYVNWNLRDEGLPGAYDNSDTFKWYGAGSSLPNSGVWTYKPSALNLGKIRAGFSIQVNSNYKVQVNSVVELYVTWYVDGVIKRDIRLFRVQAGGSAVTGTREATEFHEDFFEVDLMPGQYVACRVKVGQNQTNFGGFARQDVLIEQLSLNYVKLTEGSTINFFNYPRFKNYKWMDLLRGEIDTFDLQINTDPILKEVTIEPTHAYRIGGIDYPGYYNRKQLDFSAKVDQSKESDRELFSDYEREFILKFKDDAGDGGLKKLQDRNQAVIGMGKYVLPERFKAGKKELENRFFSPVVHYEHESFRYITGTAPQLIAIIPENISNTSAQESENTFLPKRAWYKGNVSGAGGWKFNGTVRTTLPFLFAVNYKPGGASDPIFSYSDQVIGNEVAPGLLKKFFLQRMAIFRHGRRYNAVHLKLNNYDVTNFLHRESIILGGMEYLLTHIRSYNPVDEESTACTMWLFFPVTEGDASNTYPSISSIQNGVNQNSFDLKFWPHLLLSSDIPK